ncbi:hypothetical protein LSTR_LSTR005446 [Laodelphax striatellus]|uniref:Uncharacterized protein n=1 Tax=Laodelphax striatellus TaxID=195883 RepID=A0A482WX88_LAOST|nr:hypothetical protein LSTR_LSTR005446 [Laodelphax striatellus]
MDPPFRSCFNFYRDGSATLPQIPLRNLQFVVPSSACTVSGRFESAITLKPVPTSSWRLIQSPLGRAPRSPREGFLKLEVALVSRVRILMSGTPLNHCSRRRIAVPHMLAWLAQLMLQVFLLEHPT